MASATFLKTCLNAIYFTRAGAILGKYFCGQGSIFCLHQVVPDIGQQKGFAPNAKLEITPEFLAEIITLVRLRGFETVSLAEAINRMQNPQPDHKPFAVFTLDDGYKDNMIYAQPVFDRLNCPFTVFVVPRMADGNCEIWWRVLEKIIAQTDRMLVSLGGKNFDFPARTLSQKNITWEIVSNILHNMDEHEQRKTIRRIAAEHNINVDDMCRDAAMSWDELRELNKDPLCTIGAHTINHFILTKLFPVECRNEMAESRRIISEQLGEDIKFFAYPFGDEKSAGPREFALAAAAGYQAAVTTRKGVVFAKHANHLQALPRIMVSGRYQKLRYFDALVSGLPTALLNGFRKLNVR